MEQINNEKTVQQKQVQVGQIIFTNIRNLASVCIADFDADYKESGTVDMIAVAENHDEYFKQYKDEEILIAIKYLGNNRFEEMSTGEILLVYGTGLSFMYPDGEIQGMYFVDKQYGKYSETELNYSDYLIEHPDVEQKSMYEYYQILENIIKQNQEYPLLIDANNYYFKEVSDITKRQYLKHSDELRKRIIADIKEIAIQYSNNVNQKIQTAIENIKNISSEDVEMAYLDNQLYDFERKGRTK